MNELPKVERTTLTMKETAEYLGISYWLVNQLVRKNKYHVLELVAEYYLGYEL